MEQQQEKINPYLEFKSQQEKVLSKFPQFFAFNENQFNEGLKKLGTTKKDILGTGYGGFIRKTDKECYLKMFEEIDKALNEKLKDEYFLYCAFRYELNNHEFIITSDYDDTLRVFGLQYDKLTKKQLKVLEEAKTDYLNSVE